jgi:hypothetical protein
MGLRASSPTPVAMSAYRSCPHLHCQSVPSRSGIACGNASGGVRRCSYTVCPSFASASFPFQNIDGGLNGSSQIPSHHAEMREADFGRPDDRRTAEIAPSEIGVVARDSEGVILAAELSAPCLTAPPSMSDRPVGCCFWPRFFPLDPYCQLRLIRASGQLFHRA